MSKDEKKEVIKLFMEEDDKKALKKMYKYTKDKLIKILLRWKVEYEIELEYGQTNEFYMYDDIVSYLWKKYKLK